MVTTGDGWGHPRDLFLTTILKGSHLGLQTRHHPSPDEDPTTLEPILPRDVGSGGDSSTGDLYKETLTKVVDPFVLKRESLPPRSFT